MEEHRQDKQNRVAQGEVHQAGGDEAESDVSGQVPQARAVTAAPQESLS